jgi:hypothetical protein
MILFEFQLKTTYIVSSVDVLSVAYIVSSAFYGAYCIFFFSCFYNFLLLKNIGPSNVCTQKNKNDLQFGMEYSG